MKIIWRWGNIGIKLFLVPVLLVVLLREMQAVSPDLLLTGSFLGAGALSLLVNRLGFGSVVYRVVPILKLLPLCAAVILTPSFVICRRNFYLQMRPHQGGGTEAAGAVPQTSTART